MAITVTGPARGRDQRQAVATATGACLATELKLARDMVMETPLAMVMEMLPVVDKVKALVRVPRAVMASVMDSD